MLSKPLTLGFPPAPRHVLPTLIGSIVVPITNAGAIRHFLKRRGEIESEAEMRRVAAAVLNITRRIGTALFADFVVSRLMENLPFDFRETL